MPAEPWEVPVPIEEHDLVTTNSKIDHDFWTVSEDQITRHHVIPRISMFFPEEAWSCPFDPTNIGKQRRMQGVFSSGQTFLKAEDWRANVESHQPMPEPWTGTTTFNLNNL